MAFWKSLPENSLILAEGGFVMDSIVDGPGLRCAIFVQGCPHACFNCHNPATHPFEGGDVMSVDTIYNAVKANPLCGGVTFSGGEPFCQAKSLTLLAKKLKADGYELAAYSGYTFEQLYAGTDDQKELLRYLDVLIDGPFLEAEKDLTLRFRGSKNQRILSVQDSMKEKIAVWEKRSSWIGE